MRRPLSHRDRASLAAVARPPRPLADAYVVLASHTSRGTRCIDRLARRSHLVLLAPGHSLPRVILAAAAPCSTAAMAGAEPTRFNTFPGREPPDPHPQGVDQVVGNVDTCSGDTVGVVGSRPVRWQTPMARGSKRPHRRSLQLAGFRRAAQVAASAWSGGRGGGGAGLRHPPEPLRGTMRVSFCDVGFLRLLFFFLYNLVVYRSLVLHRLPIGLSRSILFYIRN